MENKIDHYRQIDVIRDLEIEIKESNGIAPFDISHWNSGEKYKSGLLSILALDNLRDFCDYNYSYAYDRMQLEQLLKYHLNAKECALFQSSTSAIATICASLPYIGIHTVCLLNPTYFSTEECLKLNGIIVHPIHYNYDGIYHIPFDIINEYNPDAVWITQPVFSTGTYLPTEELKRISCSKYFLVCDASMCDIYNYPNIKFDYDKSMIFFSPQKVIFLNGVKFCYILCNKNMRTMLEDWGDVIAGSLPSTSQLAINHFLSDNYIACLEYHNKYIQQSKRAINDIIDKYSTIKPCGKSIGSYETFSVEDMPYTNYLNREMLKNVFNYTLTSFVPGCVNFFPKENGFCFRLNHTLDIHRTSQAMLKLIKYFSR